MMRERKRDRKKKYVLLRENSRLGKIYKGKRTQGLHRMDRSQDPYNPARILTFWGNLTSADKEEVRLAAGQRVVELALGLMRRSR